MALILIVVLNHLKISLAIDLENVSTLLNENSNIDFSTHFLILTSYVLTFSIKILL